MSYTHITINLLENMNKISDLDNVVFHIHAMGPAQLYISLAGINKKLNKVLFLMSHAI